MQDTNLKISPYFDDFDSSKNYQKVLFKPGYSVQTRELNTLQSTLQNQVERFGQHMFKEGSLVIPGNVNYNLNLKCVLVQSLINGVSVENYRESLVGKTITGATSGVKAEIVDTISQEESEKDTITLYITYNSGGIIEDGEQVKEFKNNETLVDENGTAVAITSVQNASAYAGSTVNINPGVYFVKGFFVEVGAQRIILEQYSSEPTYKVGLQVNESIVTSEDDETLYDNSLGSTNFASPGADRLKIDLKLVKQNILITESSSFIELLRFENGKLTQSQAAQYSAYNEIEKNLARRTYDESGDYTTKPYTVKVREALNNGTNGGVFLPNEKLYDGRTIVTEIPTGVGDTQQTNNYGDGEPEYIVGSDYYAVEISEGKAYVSGFEVINERKQYVVVPKPRKYQTVNNQGLALDIGSHFKLDGTQTLSGTVNFNDPVYLRDTDNNVIGRAKAIGLVSGIDLRLYVADVTVYETLTVTGTVTDLQVDDFVVGSVSGATAFVESISSFDVALRQTTGTFITGEKLKSSRETSGTALTITNIVRNQLENTRKIEKIIGGVVGFSSVVKLDAVSISGSSFEVSSNVLTGSNTSFDAEVFAKSRLRFPGVSSDVEVDSSGSTSVTLNSGVTVPDGTYYSVSKLVCKLNTGRNGLTTRASLNPVKKRGVTESDYSHSRLITASHTTDANGNFTIQGPIGTTIDVNSIVITSSSAKISATFTRSGNDTVIVDTSAGSGVQLNVYYGIRINNPTVRKKTKKYNKFILVDKTKLSEGQYTQSNTYGTRFEDKDISLKFPDVASICCVHQAVRSADTTADMFDRLVLNSTSTLKLGDMITLGTIRAKVLNISGNTVNVKYHSESKFQSGLNLAISVTVPTNTSAVGLFIRESHYGRYEDITDDFKFVRNDNANFYQVSKLVRKSSAAEPNNKIIVVFDYFEHDNLTSDFYSVESYGDLKYEQIPYAYNYISMGDLIDFRYYVSPSSVSGTDGSIGSPFKETVSAFDLYKASFTGNQKVPFPTSIFGLDYDFYLGRIDKVYMTTASGKYGAFTGLARVIEGSSAIEPVESDDKSAGLLLATITLPPYLRNVSEAKIKLEKTRNYTMRDIGKLEERLSNVENYTSLSLLEVNTNNLNILDDEGRNRFKNGFVVDSFVSTTVADTSNPDYTASIDLDKNIARPYPCVNNTGVSFNVSGSTASKSGNYVTIPHEEIPFISQEYSSRVENILAYEIFSWVGNMEITPKKDIWYDTQREIVEGQNINLVDAYTSLFDLVVPGGTIWDGWQQGAGGTVNVGGGREVTDIRAGVQYEVDNLNFDIESGDTIQSITDVRFSRSRVITVGVSSLKPNTKFYFSINESGANNIIYPKLLTGLKMTRSKFIIGEQLVIGPLFEDRITRIALPLPISARVIDPSTLGDFTIAQTDFDSSGYTSESTILAIDNITSDASGESDIGPTQIGSKFYIYGMTSGARAEVNTHPPLMSDNFGNLNAFVLLPSRTYETGDLTFALSDQPNNQQIKGLTGSYATGMYYSQGTEISVTSNVTTMEVPELTATAVTDSRVRFIPNPPPRHDPLAQSFFINDEGGAYITSIDLFFATKDNTVPVLLDIRTVENGAPSNLVVPGTSTSVAAKDINTSLDASVPTKFKFKNPVYLSSSSDYVFVIRTTVRSYNVWVSRLGEADVTTGLVIDKQPYVGVLYKSTNQSIWTPDQYEDIKFVINRAQFQTNQTYTAVLPNKPIKDQQLIKNPLTFSSGNSTVKVFQPNHGMHQVQNQVTLSGIASDTSLAQLDQTIAADATTITINDVTGASFAPSTVEGWNKIDGLVVSSTNPGYIKIDDEIISYSGISGSSLTGCIRGANSTTASNHEANAAVQCFQLNGIILSELNKTHAITNVISLDEYEIVVQSAANSSKQTGGPGVRASRNIQYESMTPNFNIFTPANTTSSISTTTISGTSISSPGNVQQSFIERSAETVENRVENIMNEPKLVLSQTNENAFRGGQRGSLTTVISMSTTNDRLSPLVDLDGSSITTISNRLNKEVDDNGDLDLTSELTPFGGKHSAYITKKVVLETSATSVKVLFDAIRNTSNEIKVFVKIKGDSTPGSFEDMNYVEIPAVTYPTSATKKEFRAFDFEIKSLKEFQEFSVKVVMTGTDQSAVPKLRNFRALALAL